MSEKGIGYVVVFSTLIAAMWLFCWAGYRTGKRTADHWYASHYCLLGHKACWEYLNATPVHQNHETVFKLESTHGKTVVITPGTVNGNSTLILNEGVYCIFHSENNVDFTATCLNDDK